MGEQADGSLQQTRAGVAGVGGGTGRIDRRVHIVDCTSTIKRLI
jgi:hypothetical protein